MSTLNIFCQFWGGGACISSSGKISAWSTRVDQLLGKKCDSHRTYKKQVQKYDGQFIVNLHIIFKTSLDLIDYKNTVYIQLYTLDIHIYTGYTHILCDCIMHIPCANIYTNMFVKYVFPVEMDARSLVNPPSFLIWWLRYF